MIKIKLNHTRDEAHEFNKMTSYTLTIYDDTDNSHKSVSIVINDNESMDAILASFKAAIDAFKVKPSMTQLVKLPPDYEFWDEN